MSSNLEFRKLINLPPDLIEALGEVSARYGQIEHLLTMTIHRTDKLLYDEAFAKVQTIRGGRKGIFKTAKKNFIDWARREHGDVEGTKRSEEFNDLIEAWNDLADRRDDVIHCCWSVGSEDNQLSGTRKGELLKKDGRPLDIKDVKVLANDLTQLVVQLNKATMPNALSGPEEVTAQLPAKFTPAHTMSPGIETRSTAAAAYTPSDTFVKKVSD